MFMGFQRVDPWLESEVVFAVRGEAQIMCDSGRNRGGRAGLRGVLKGLAKAQGMADRLGLKKTREDCYHGDNGEGLHSRGLYRPNQIQTVFTLHAVALKKQRAKFGWEWNI
jgi:hypothetical protein